MPRLPRLPDAASYPLLLILVILSSCAGPSTGVFDEPARAPEREAGRGGGVPGVEAPGGDWVDLGFLSLPRKEDTVLFSCAGKEFFKHQAYDLLMEQDPRRGLQLLHAMADLALAAQVAREEGIRVPRAEVDRLVNLGMKKDLERARRNFGPRTGLADFAALELGMGLGEYKSWLRKMAARQLLLSYTVVYTAMREDRVRCRFMTLSSKEEAERLARSVREGADFQTLARKYSLDPTASQGGRIPPFSRDFEHPVARAAFALKVGQVSDPIPGRQGDRDVWFLVFLEEKIPGKKGSFRDLEKEIRRRVRESPPDPEDFLAFFGAARRRYGLRLFPGGNTRGAHERGTGSILESGRPASEGGRGTGKSGARGTSTRKGG